MNIMVKLNLIKRSHKNYRAVVIMLVFIDKKPLITATRIKIFPYKISEVKKDYILFDKTETPKGNLDTLASTIPLTWIETIEDFKGFAEAVIREMRRLSDEYDIPWYKEIGLVDIFYNDAHN